MATMWIKRFIERVERDPGGGEGTKRQHAVAVVLEERESYADDEAMLDALLELMPADQPLCAASLARIAGVLRVPPGGDIDAAAQVRFWSSLAEGFPIDPDQVVDPSDEVSPHVLAPACCLVHACCAEAMLSVGDGRQALERFLPAAEVQPDLMLEFGDTMGPIAERVGGTLWLRFQLVDLRASIAGRIDGSGGSDGFDSSEITEDIHERYAELLNEHRHDSEALGRIRPVGAWLNRLSDAGVLPRVFVRRGE